MTVKNRSGPTKRWRARRTSSKLPKMCTTYVRTDGQAFRRLKIVLLAMQRAIALLATQRWLADDQLQLRSAEVRGYGRPEICFFFCLKDSAVYEEPTRVMQQTTLMPLWCQRPPINRILPRP